MDLLVSRKKKSTRKRLFPFFGSQKPTGNAFVEDRSRYYDFADTPVLFRPPSPLIDRQNISSDLNEELRDSCAVLFRGIELVETPCYSRPESVKADKGHTQAEAEAEAETMKKSQSPSNYLSPNIGSDTATRRGKHDSGIDLEGRRSSGQGVEISQFYETASEPKSQSVRTSIQSIKSLVFQSSGTDVSHDQDPHTLAFLSERSLCKSFEGEDSEAVEVFLNPDTTSKPCRVPSLSRPQTSRLTRKQCFENLQDVTPDVTLRNSTAFSELDFSDPNHVKQDTRPATAIELGVSYHQEKGHGAVVIDSNGLVHVMSAEEEAQRRADLQRAVTEKMTGIIGANTESSSNLPDNAKRENLAGHGKKETTTNSPPPKGKSLLHKLSVFALGKRKTTARKKDTSVFDRITEAV
ncbi:hypothetical protein ASPWEDRAFT_167466 [Aspergillus wentii DTO 134E9]|uniref:Uncharacterized protein n=1 Tax=Aspergillus wentii DTO 134E9 TaxID=1073089 RepID=A0A1L9S2R9_ASPWE|nr:uncharacterized protein ASPWEDRAFT_167466 [Aspergillus wentii DTO 134E9]KAI9924490.1 hypothetical protein MW887_007117 [Aspergillus wentii]OJJ41451.1 hypothetical protein ASPWEDRAFT_167466 [Aspergillus wentii DTO 134E9]